MALVKGKFVDQTTIIKSSQDPVDNDDLSRKSYVDGVAASKVEDAIVEGVSDKAPSQDAVFSALALKQDSIGTGTSKQFLKGDLTWDIPTKGANVLTVGIDADTIADCIALCDSPSATNNYIIEIPPGAYTESLTIPCGVHLKGMTNPSDSLSVKITGLHTVAGASANPINNRFSAANILFVGSHATTPLFSLSGTADTEIQMSGCFLQNSNSATTAKVFAVGANVRLYINNCKLRMASSGNGGTHFSLEGGVLYTQYGLDVDGGTCVLDMSVPNYAQLQYAQLFCQGSSAIKIPASGMVVMNQSSLTNTSATGNGVNMLGAGASFFAAHSAFNIQENASTYIVTGVAGSVYGHYANNYSNIPGVLSRNTKIGSSVTKLNISNSLTSLDISDFAAAAKASAVSDAIADGVTDKAPSQNAVYDALQLKLDTSLKGAANGLAELDGDGLVPLSQLPSSLGAVQSVNSQTGDVVLDTDDISEGAANKYFSDSLAKAAVVDDSISDGITDKAPSQNAVFDALALKVDSADVGAANGIASLGADGKIPSSQIPSIAISDTFVVASEAAMLAVSGAETGDIAVRTDLNKSFILAGTDSSVLADWQELLTPTDAVQSVNGQTGSVSLDTDDIAEGAANKYFSDALAKAAAVADSITDGVTDVAPSQDAVHAALALKADASHTHVAADITDFAAEAKAAAVVDSTAGSETDQAASVSAMKSYVASEIGAIVMPSGKKERFVLSATDISNGYVDCAEEALAETMILMTGGVIHNEGSGEDYVLSLVGGVTRITFEPDLSAMLVEGDDIYVQYLK